MGVEIVHDDMEVIAPKVEGQEPEKKEPEKEEVKEQPKVNRSEKRIKELLSKNRILEKRLEKLEKQATKKKEESKEPEDDEELDPADFDTYDDYLAAIEEKEKKLKSENGLKEEEEPKEGEVEGEESQLGVDPDEFIIARDNLLDKFEEDKVAEKIKDFKEKVFDPNVPITPQVVTALNKLDKPAEVAYYLATHKAEARSIATSDPIEVGIALAKIERKLSSQAITSSSKKITNAPEPITPVEGAGVSFNKKPGEMSYEEYEKWMNTQEKKRKFW